MLESLIVQLTQSVPLSETQVRDALAALTGNQTNDETKAAFLTALAAKGETIEEITAFARGLRQQSIRPPLDPMLQGQLLLDVCGTGGDRLQTINISTAVAFIAAAAGIRVAKHGNRAITSQSGSADVLEALGFNIEMPPERSAALLRDHHFAFFFAPSYHPAFKHIAPARKLCAARGQRTLFNFLGPLLNPVAPSAQLLGLSAPALCEPLARVLKSLGTRQAMVVCGGVPSSPGSAEAWLDECSSLAFSRAAYFSPNAPLQLLSLDPAQFPIQPASLDDLRGGDRHENAACLRRLLAGEERGPKRDAILLNAAAALYVAGHVATLIEGWHQAAALVDSGQVSAKLDAILAASKAIPNSRGAT